MNSQDLQFVNDLVLRAGSIALESKAEDWNIEYKAPGDAVTAIDRQLSTLIVSELKSHFPNDGIISEEIAVLPEEWAHERVWIIDPIDGTRHFINGNGEWAVMVGLLINLQPVFGWVYRPTKDCLYYGGKDHGAFRQHDRSTTAFGSCSQKIPPIIMAGGRDPIRSKLDNLWKGTRIIRRGSMGLKVMAILEGETDLAIQSDVHSKQWDTAAPLAIGMACGLVGIGLDAKPLHYGSTELAHLNGVLIGLPYTCQEVASRLQ
jgi:3'-phosphoadenosine 5'-phosphosulfate (PAPS) 3'-phosphatase